MEQFTHLKSAVVPLLVDDIDTDQIIPARFLKVTDKVGLGKLLFHDWRYAADGKPKPDFILNHADQAGRQILVAKNNFGCGSSREHAPWALFDFGFRVVVARSFADIFRNNALKNGLLPVSFVDEAHDLIEAKLAHGETLTLEIDLEAQVARLPDAQTFAFEIDGFAKKCILQGMDQLEYLASHDAAIAAFEARQ
ncbi:MAG: 3-isopropylmalate dehydratase small subunit [Deltaproteobacteria bacterium]|nr:3-isopropylmalate dehydratase small subunit [Deltaproteobacteria bacterium]